MMMMGKQKRMDGQITFFWNSPSVALRETHIQYIKKKYYEGFSHKVRKTKKYILAVMWKDSSFCNSTLFPYVTV